MLGFSVALGTCFLFLYTRKSKWFPSKIKWLASIILILLGTSGFILTPIADNENILLYWGLCVPFISYSFDRLFKYICEKKYNRDFILWLKNSDEIDDSIFGKNPHVKPLDKLFSVAMIFIIMLGTLLGGILANFLSS